MLPNSYQSCKGISRDIDQLLSVDELLVILEKLHGEYQSEMSVG